MKFACQRKRLRAAVSYYGRMVQPPSSLKDLYCPVLYHQAGHDAVVPTDEIEQLRALAAEHQKRVHIRTYPDAPHAFSNEMRPESYRKETAEQAWMETVAFLKKCFEGT